MTDQPTEHISYVVQRQGYGGNWLHLSSHLTNHAATEAARRWVSVDNPDDRPIRIIRVVKRTIVTVLNQTAGAEEQP